MSNGVSSVLKTVALQVVDAQDELSGLLSQLEAFGFEQNLYSEEN